MHNKKLTEEDVYKGNYKLIQDICRYNGKSLERDDRENEAALGFINAIRSYRRGFSTFEQHAATCMKAGLHISEASKRKSKRIEHPLSLDMQVKSAKGTTTYGDLIAYSDDNDATWLFQPDFLNRLDKRLQHIALLCLQQYTTEEIAERLHISVIEVEKHISILGCKLKEYNNE